jgi:hypothetical protein
MKCKTCGKNADSEYCFAHKPRKPLSSSGRGLTSEMSVISSIKAKNVNNDGHNQQREFFLSIWKKRRHYSEVSGVYLGKEPMSTYFHHILPKEKYLEACLDEENIILLTLEEHSNVENDMYRYEEVNKRRNHLLTKYERT